jgi:hypothetical protein
MSTSESADGDGTDEDRSERIAELERRAQAAAAGDGLVTWDEAMERIGNE